MIEHYKNVSLENISEIIDGELVVEQWKDIIGWENIYQVSNFGRVKTLARKSEYGHFGGISIWTTIEKIKKQSFTKKKYLSVSFNANRVFKTFPVHRLVAIHFILNLENKPQVNHKWGIKWDNRASQLEWATSREDRIHAIHVLKVKSGIGIKNANSKLTEEQVVLIRKMRDEGISYYKISKIFNMDRSTIRDICLRTIWKHVA